jgi:hypothetical protein
MFYDADGDLAHEFYEEVVGGLRRLTEGGCLVWVSVAGWIDGWMGVWVTDRCLWLVDLCGWVDDVWTS